MSCYTILSILCHFMLPIVLETFGTFKRGNSHCLVQCRMRSAASVDVAGTSVCSTARNPLGTLWQEPSPEFQQAYWWFMGSDCGWRHMLYSSKGWPGPEPSFALFTCCIKASAGRSLQLWKRPLLCNWCTDVYIIRTYGYILRMANQISNHRIQMQWTTLMTWHGQSARRLNKKWSPTKSKPRRQCQEFQIQRPLGSSEARKAWQADLQSRTSSVVGTSCWKEWRMLKDDESWWKYTTFTGLTVLNQRFALRHGPRAQDLGIVPSSFASRHKRSSLRRGPIRYLVRYRQTSTMPRPESKLQGQDSNSSTMGSNESRHHKAPTLIIIQFSEIRW